MKKQDNLIEKITKQTINSYLVKEAMMDGFSYEKLNSIRSFAERIRYCKQYLGKPIGSGSGRMVFQLDDEKCLKLAKNKKGIAQNEAEDENYQGMGWNQDLVPQCFEHAENYSWMITEYVLLAKKSDFKYLYNISWEEYCNFVWSCYYEFARRTTFRHGGLDKERFLEILENNEGNFLHTLHDYITNWQIEQIGDFTRLANLGLAMRNGDPQIVILDNGLNEEVFNTYYKRF